MSREPWNDSPADEIYEDEPLEDPEGPQPCDLDRNEDIDEYDTVACPHCGHAISELAEQCPHCGDWIVQKVGAGSRRRLLWIAIAILLVVLILLWVF
jgi:DNA-directed RNA polymerase subunit RPC12/RpoP